MLCFFPIVVYVCVPLDIFHHILKAFQSEGLNPEDYAIFYLDMFGESLRNGAFKPWLNAEINWSDPIKLFQVEYRKGRWPIKCITHS